MHCTMVFTDTCLDLFVVYRPPPLRANGLKTSDFFDDWSIFLDAQILKSWDIPITGDFNLHPDVPNNPDAMRFNNLLDVHGLKQHVNEPTHMLGHTLDLIIARDLSRLLCDAVAVVDPGLTDSRDNYSGDHFAIFASLNFNKPSRHRKTVTFRKYASINLTELASKIKKFDYFSICLDESTDAVDTAQMLIFVRGIDRDFIVTEELLSMESLKHTTGEDLFRHLCDCFDRHKLQWDKFVSVTTDGAPSLTGKNVGLVKKVNDKVSGMYCGGRLMAPHVNKW